MAGRSKWQGTEPPRTPLLEHGSILWRALQRAVVIASIVRGTKFPRWIGHIVPEITDPWVALLSGDLRPAGPERAPKHGAVRYWLLWGSDQACGYSDPRVVNVLIGTRRRIAGAAAVRIGGAPPGPVGLRLEPDRWERRGDLLAIGVGSNRYGIGGDPLVLDLSKPDGSDASAFVDMHVGPFSKPAFS